MAAHTTPGFIQQALALAGGFAREPDVAELMAVDLHHRDGKDGEVGTASEAVSQEVNLAKELGLEGLTSTELDSPLVDGVSQFDAEVALSGHKEVVEGIKEISDTAGDFVWTALKDEAALGRLQAVVTELEKHGEADMKDLLQAARDVATLRSWATSLESAHHAEYEMTRAAGMAGLRGSQDRRRGVAAVCGALAVVRCSAAWLCLRTSLAHTSSRRRCRTPPPTRSSPLASAPTGAPLQAR